MVLQTLPNNPTQSFNRGRNPELLTKRNEALIKRFYYWFETKRTRIDDVYVILSREFFISSRTVENIVRDNSDLLDKLYIK